MLKYFMSKFSLFYHTISKSCLKFLRSSHKYWKNSDHFPRKCRETMLDNSWNVRKVIVNRLHFCTKICPWKKKWKFSWNFQEFWSIWIWKLNCLEFAVFHSLLDYLLKDFLWYFWYTTNYVWFSTVLKLICE